MSFRLNSQKNVPANNCRYNIMVVLELPASSRVGFMVSTKPGIHAFKMYGLPTFVFPLPGGPKRSSPLQGDRRPVNSCRHSVKIN